MLENQNKNKHVALSLVLAISLSGCTNSVVDRLEWVGKEPPLKKIENPVEASEKITWPSAAVAPTVSSKSSNSLWGNNSRDYFRDQRARKIGDILTVKVSIKDKAEIDNKTERKRSSSDSLGAPSVFGLEKLATGFLPGKANPSSLLSVNGSMDNSGEGTIEREEVIDTEIAAVVTQVMPNGNMLIYGSQEVRVNHEIRQLTIEGVIRAEDISPTNKIESQRIAEARISYGGKGLISDVQQPRLGNQIIDIISPW